MFLGPRNKNDELQNNKEMWGETVWHMVGSLSFVRFNFLAVARKQQMDEKNVMFVKLMV